MQEKDLHILELRLPPKLIMGEVRESIEKWTTMPISMIGRINLIKMVTLPKFLYLFQSLPLPLPKHFFKEINKILCRFIWNNRKPRFRLRLLYLPYDRGGLQIPNLQWYYWAAQLRCVMFYFLTRSPPAWVSIEQTISMLPLRLYLYSSDPKTLKKTNNKSFPKEYHWYMVQSSQTYWWYTSCFSVLSYLE